MTEFRNTGKGHSAAMPSLQAAFWRASGMGQGSTLHAQGRDKKGLAGASELGPPRG